MFNPASCAFCDKLFTIPMGGVISPYGPVCNACKEKSLTETDSSHEIEADRPDPTESYGFDEDWQDTMKSNSAFDRAWLVVKMPARDVRYKITPENVEYMRELRESGMSYAAISRQLMEEGIPASPGIVLYWCNEASRMAQRAKNAKRTYVPGSPENARRIARDQAKRKENWEADPDMKLRHQIQSAMDETRSERHTIHGESMEDAQAKIHSGELTRPNAKIPERERHEDYE